jgi:hypothetical protein
MSDMPDLNALPPYRFCALSNKVFGRDHHGGETPVCDVRGWGYLTGKGGGLGLDDLAAIEVQKRTGETIAFALNSRADLPAPVRVKDLVWFDYGTAQHPNSQGSVAEASDATYRVSLIGDRWHGTWTAETFDTLEAAKAAAQADYTARILAALETAPDAMADPRVVALVEAVERMMEQCEDGDGYTEAAALAVVAALEAAKGAGE